MSTRLIPIATIVGRLAEMSREEQGAVPAPLDQEPGYETGGFDIMKQLVKRQRKHQDIRKVADSPDQAKGEYHP